MCEKIKKYISLNNTVLVVACVLAGSWAFGAINVMNHNYDLQRQVDQANLSNQVMQLQNQNLKLEQAYYQTDEYLGLQARTLLGKANPGEHLVILPENAASVTDNTAAATATTAASSNLNQWMDFLFGQH